MAGLGPATVAIHDDGNVIRQALGIELAVELLLFAVEFVESSRGLQIELCSKLSNLSQPKGGVSCCLFLAKDDFKVLGVAKSRCEEERDLVLEMSVLLDFVAIWVGNCPEDPANFFLVTDRPRWQDLGD